MPPVAEIFYQQSLAKSESKESLRTKRDMHTLAVMKDHLAVGRYREAADTAGRRMNAVELAARTGTWKTVAQVELVPQDNPLSLVGDQEVEMAGNDAKKKEELDTFLTSQPGSSRLDDKDMNDNRRPWDKDQNYQWIEQKGKGKGKDKKEKGDMDHKKPKDKKKKKKSKCGSSSD